MISRLKGIVLTRDPDGLVEVETSGGVVYEVDVPLTVLQRMPPAGQPVELRTVQVVRDDALELFGFLEGVERDLFQRLMTVNGVGARLALALMSAYAAHRLARALVEKDVNALKQVSGVGKKTAERLALELADKVQDLALGGPEPGAPSVPGAQEAVAALVALGYSFADADDAVRAVVENGGPGGAPTSADELIRKALART